MLDLYRNIKKLREERKMSQDELAKLTGYTSRSSIAKIEKGEVDLPQSKIIAFANALKTTPGALMGLTEVEKSYKPQTIAAHFNTSDLTAAELEDVEDYIEYIRNKRRK